MYGTKILVCGDTVPECESTHMFRFLGHCELRGFSQATPVYELVSEKRLVEAPEARRSELFTDITKKLESDDVTGASQKLEDFIHEFPTDEFAVHLRAAINDDAVGACGLTLSQSRKSMAFKGF